MNKIQHPVDFAPLRQLMQDWRRQNLEHAQDFLTFESNIERLINKYSDHLVNYRRTHKTAYLQRADQELENIRKLVDYYEKLGVLAILMRKPTNFE